MWNPRSPILIANWLNMLFSLSPFPSGGDLPPLQPSLSAMRNQPPAIQTFEMPQMPRIRVRLRTGIAAIVLLIILAWTSYYTVQAESEAVVLRFGKFLKTVEPGLHFKLPLGIDQVTV